MAEKPQVVVDSYPGVRGVNSDGYNRWYAVARSGGWAAHGYGGFQRTAERRAVRNLRRLMRTHRRRVV